MGRVKEILNTEFGMQKFCLVDNNRPDKMVKGIADIDIEKMNDYCWLIACVDDANFTEITRSLDEHNIDKQNVEDVFWNFYYFHLKAPKFMIYDAQRQGITLAQYYENHYNLLGVKTETVIDSIANIVKISEGGIFAKMELVQAVLWLN